MIELRHFKEPKLIFGFKQSAEDPRDGLTLFGPLHQGSPFGINYGLIGTNLGIARFYRWLETTRRFLAVPQVSKRSLWVPFPGFQEAFQVPLATRAIQERKIDEGALKQILTSEGDPFQRVFKAVGIYEDVIHDSDKNSDEDISLWFVITPESVYKDCRPKSQVPGIERVSREAMKKRKEFARQAHEGQEYIFEGQEEDYFAYEFDNDFRRQLKARRILHHAKAPIQILRESTLTPDDFLDRFGSRERDLEPDSQIAWNLLSTVYYKAGGKPWRLASTREGVCYLGLVYKKLNSVSDERSSCCAAQMFLDSGDGVVFRGAVGPWKSRETEEYHLNSSAAKEIVERAVLAYHDLNPAGGQPKELFIHGRAYFNEEEWRGFASVTKLGIRTVGVRIRHSTLRLFRKGKYPILRGAAYVETPTKGCLWTTGFVPRLKTNPYQGFPRPLEIEICQGSADIGTVLEDILALTKLNYNSCHHADGEPITLKFADKIGEILTAGPIERDTAPLSFKYYI